MMQRVKPFWFVLVALLASVTLLLAVSCAADSEAETDDDDGSGGNTSASGSGSDSSGTTGSGAGSGDPTGSGAGSGDPTGNGAGSGDPAGSGSTLDAGVIGPTTGPVSTGTVPENGTCTYGGADFAAMMPVPMAMSGTCAPSETDCPGGSARISDCAQGLVCCIDTDQCDAIAPDMLAAGMMVDSVSCVTAGTCPSSFIVAFERPIELPGCPAGQSCCLTIQDGGIALDSGAFAGLLEAGMAAFLDGGMGALFEGGIGALFEGGFPFEGGMPNLEAGTATPISDAGTTPQFDAGQQ